jgi:carboxymethylenebutenolidase
MATEPNRPDLGAVFDAHVASEFETEDLDATMATMVDQPSVHHVPTLAGGVGAAAVRAFYNDHFIGHWPRDTAITKVSRTVGTDQVVDELVMHFTHDCVMDTFLPGMAPSGRRVRLPVVVVAGFRDGRVASERIYWDQASLLVQVGALDPAGLPVSGDEQAATVLGEDEPANPLMSRAIGTGKPLAGEFAASEGFDHVTLVVTDVTEAETFLAVLGFEREKAVVARGPVMSAFMGIADWESDHITLVHRGAPVRQEVQLLRFHHPTVAVDQQSGFLARTGFNHVCFRVRDLDDALRRFAACGHEPRNEVMDFHDRRLVFLDGPSGVVVELAEWKVRPVLPG